MRDYNIIFYVLGVFLCFIGFIMYNYAISNDRQLILAALTIGVGITFLLTCYL